jgi:glycosyltransferase involved in cell wall biosynthesis
MKSICIIIPVRNRKQYTQHILAQIHEQISIIKRENISVVVIDDGSTDGTPETVLSQFPSVHLIHGDGSLWWTGAICLGMNYAIKNLDYDYILWLNDDISLAGNFIDKVIQICEIPWYKESVIGGIVRDLTYFDWIVFSGVLKKQYIRNPECFGLENTIEVDALNGNITLIPRIVIETIGLPNSTKFKHYGGDFEFTMRAKKFGFKVILSRELQATTDYQITDFIRYMPPLMQWHIETDLSKRKEIIKGFTNFKSNYNIWHIVNLINLDCEKIPKWKYTVYYVKQIVKLMVSDWFATRKLSEEIENYLKQQNTPLAIAEAILSRRS